MTAHPTSRHREHTLTEFLRRRHPGMVPRLGHRIDRETSGVVLATRTLEADRKLKGLFERREVEKLYLALVRGRLEPASGRVELPLGPARSARIHIRMETRPDGLPARTDYRTLLEAGPYALVAAEPKTGRQHQIRAHLAAVGCPIVGDKIYDADGEVFLEWIAGDRKFTDDMRARLVLTLGDRRRFTAAVPHDMAELIERHAGPDWRDALPSLGRPEPGEWP